MKINLLFSLLALVLMFLAGSVKQIILIQKRILGTLNFLIVVLALHDLFTLNVLLRWNMVLSIGITRFW